MHAIKAIYDGAKFLPIQTVPIKENYKVIITFIEPVGENIPGTDQLETIKLPRSTSRGLLRGKVKMSTDFNESLEVMEEYME